jgi:hypothetical protein
MYKSNRSRNIESGPCFSFPSFPSSSSSSYSGSAPSSYSAPSPTSYSAPSTNSAPSFHPGYQTSIVIDPYAEARDTYIQFTRGLQRDVVYLGWPIAPSYEPNCGGRGGAAGFQPMRTNVYKTWSPNKLWRSNSKFNLFNFPVNSGIPFS